MINEQVAITTEYITLGQFLKMTDFIQTGGAAKPFLDTYVVLVDGVEESRRGKKLYRGSIIEFPENARYEIVSKNDVSL